MRTEDGNMIQECLNGKPQAFGMLVDKYKEGVYAFVYAELGNFQDAQDVTQEVFLQAYRDLRNLRRWESFVFWLYRIARRQCIQWFRVRSRRVDLEPIEDQASEVMVAHSLDSYRDSQLSESLGEALDSLTETHREVLMLYYFGGMNSKEIARATGSSPGAIRVRLSRARVRLREEIVTMMDTAFEGQRIPAGFTLRIVEAVKHIKIRPMPRVPGLSLGLSLAAGIIIAVISLNPSLSISDHMAAPKGSPLPIEARVLKIGEIPVEIIRTDRISAIGDRQEDGHGGKPEHQNIFLPAPSAQGDTWTELVEMPTARYNHCSAAVNGKIYAIGGFDKNKNLLSKVEEYDPATKNWVRKADIPGEGRAVASASVVDDKIYVISGGAGGGVPSSIVHEYDPKTDTWEQKSDIPTARYYFSTSVVEGKIYAIGGASTPFGPSIPQVEEYDPASDTWTKKKNAPNPRQLMSAAVVEGKIYVMGGYIPLATTPLVEEYDPKTDTWVSKANMPTARSEFSVGVVDGKIYAIGGVLNNVILDVVEVYDPKSDSWETKTSMPAKSDHHTSCVVDGRIYVMGGATVFAPKNNFVPTLANFFQYNPERDFSVNARGKLPTVWGKVKSE